MDWANLFKDYPLLIPALATVLAAILGFFFVRWNSTHNTKLEFQKKEYDRRAAIWDMRIKEAREYIDLYDSLVDTSKKFIDSILNANTLEDFYKWKKYYGIGEKLDEFLLNKGSKRTSTKVLNDKQLNSLVHRLRKQISTTLNLVGNVSEQIDKVADNEAFQEIKKQHDWKELEDGFYDLDITLIAIKNQLDKLARKVG